MPNIQAPYLASLGALAVLTLSACASTRPTIDYEQLAGPSVSSVRFNRLHNWQPINDTQLVIWTDLRSPVLVNLSFPCRELDFNHSIGVTSFGHQIVAGFDKVIVDGDPACRIKSLHRLDPKALRAAQKQVRDAKRG